MGRHSSLFLVFIASLLCTSLTGCLFRNRTPEHTVLKDVNLHQATLDQLVENIDSEAGKIKTLNATVDIDASSGGPKKGKVTDYTSIRGYILMRKPEMLRMFGLFPVVRNRAFDMASDGKTFKLSIPTLNKFVVGPNDAPEKPSPNTLENLRPRVILESLLLHEIQPDETPVLEQSTEQVRDARSKKIADVPNYIVDIIKKDGNHSYLARKIVFSRVDLKPHRQLIYDKQGQLVTEAKYENFADFAGISFPSTIVINRPQDEYSIQLNVAKLNLNQPLKDEQFELKQPDGTVVQALK